MPKRKEETSKTTSQKDTTWQDVLLGAYPSLEPSVVTSLETLLSVIDGVASASPEKVEWVLKCSSNGLVNTTSYSLNETTPSRGSLSLSEYIKS